MKILIAGLPGSGKTTQGQLLAASLNIPIIGTGVLLREVVKKEDDFSKRIQEEMAKGEFVDDSIVSDLVKARLEEADCQNGFILDGYPRSLEQLHLFDPKLEKVIYLRLSDNEVKVRLLGRGRDDDKEDVIENRFEVYHHETEPLIEYFKDLGILSVVDGHGTVEEVQAKIKEALNLDLNG
jgi:adenylate kinase